MIPMASQIEYRRDLVQIQHQRRRRTESGLARLTRQRSASLTANRETWMSLTRRALRHHLLQKPATP